MMFPTAFLLLSLVSVVTSSYVNEFGETFLFKCPPGKSIASWESFHSTSAKDRRFQFTCQKTPGLVGRCQWHGYLNKLDEPVNFQCPNDGVISGVDSFYHDGAGDRRFKVYCCSLLSRHLEHCVKTDYVNDWNARLNFRMPAAHFLKGVCSIHSNVYEDRRWKFETCELGC